jgi:hypothetical protein
VFPPLQMMWSINNRPTPGDLAAGNIGGAFFQFANGLDRIYLLGLADTETDEYDRHVIAHEFGHYLNRAFSRSDSIGGSHSLDSRLDMRVAFGEGFGDGFSGIALNDPFYSDSAGVGQASGFRFDMAALQSTNRGWYNERSFMYLLWHLNANPGIGFTPLWSVMTGLPSTLRADGALASVHHFLHRLKATVPAQAGAIDTLAANQQITIADALGSNESNNGGVPLALPIYKPHNAASGVAQNYCVTDAAGVGTSQANRLGAQAFIRFTLPSAAARTLTVESTNGATASDPDFRLFRPDGTSTSHTAAGTGRSLARRWPPAPTSWSCTTTSSRTRRTPRCNRASAAST